MPRRCSVHHMVFCLGGGALEDSTQHSLPKKRRDSFARCFHSHFQQIFIESPCAPGTVGIIMIKTAVISVLMELSHCKTIVQEMPIFLLFPQRQCSSVVKGMGSGAGLPGF